MKSSVQKKVIFVSFVCISQCMCLYCMGPVLFLFEKDLRKEMHLLSGWLLIELPGLTCGTAVLVQLSEVL